ncbi:MAG: 8-oxoguanine DNA glycosylase, partial [Bacilli bacterium]
KSINEIARRWGEKVLFDDKTYYLFPEYCALKDVSIQEYKECKVGFRDKYIYNFVKRVNDNQSYLQSIYSLSTDEALLSLMQSPGIGPKVASCILLFAYQKYDVFPVDTWVKKIFKNIYGIENESNIRAFAKKTYGKYSGVAIQYLFHTSRNK